MSNTLVAFLFHVYGLVQGLFCLNPSYAVKQLQASDVPMGSLLCSLSSVEVAEDLVPFNGARSCRWHRWLRRAGHFCALSRLGRWVNNHNKCHASSNRCLTSSNKEAIRNKCLTTSNNNNLIRILINSFLLLLVRHLLLLARHL